MWYIVDDTYTKAEVGGLSTYSRFMIEAFEKADVEVELLSNFVRKSKFFRIINYFFGYKRSINLIGLLNIDLLGKIDGRFNIVYFDTYHFVNNERAEKIYITVHDFSSFHTNTGYGRWPALLKYKSLRRMTVYKDRIRCVSISQKTQIELKKFFDLDSCVIHNPLQDLSISFLNSEKQYEYFLMIGSYHVRKGYEEVIELWSRNEKLIIVGRNLKTLEAHKSSKIIIEENVDSYMLSTLVKGAKGLIWNSKDEGFGMPIFEVLRAGLPVYSLVNIPVANEFKIAGYSRITDVNDFEQYVGAVMCESKFPTKLYNGFYGLLLFD